jgi:glycosyltransferase involved in cell wall biosynthesis
MGVGWASWYDCVIPNYFDTDDFEYREDKSDYLLYIGRIVKDKGVDIVIQLADTLKTKLILAGPGDLTSIGYGALGDNIVHIGFADVERRKQLLRDARCLLLPSYYLEPFGCVVAEALLSGTPVVTTDWGAFPEINLHGITGYRCRTFEQFVWAVKNIDTIQASACREWAVNNFAMGRVKYMYEEYFRMVYEHFLEAGFYAENTGRTELGWLTRSYPQAKNPQAPGPSS